MVSQRKAKIQTPKATIPIDRGYAWVVCLASSGLFGFIAGSYKTMGVIQVELQEEFPLVPASQILWVMRLGAFVSKLSGPINSYLFTKFTFRTMVMIGVLIMASSIITFGYLPRVEYMYVVMGGLYGFGAGIISLVSFTGYSQYFDKKKALALGITASGSGIGTIIIPPILRYLFDHYTFSSAMLLFGGFSLQFLVLGALMRPVAFYENLAKRRNKTLDEGFQANKYSELRFQAEHAMEGNKNSDDGQVNAYEAEERPIITENSVPKQCSSLKAADDLEPSVLFNSSNELHGSSMFLPSIEQEKSDLEAGCEAEKKSAKPKFNWRIALSPTSIVIGFSTLFYSGGVGVVYQCIPPLGKDTGVSKDLIAILLVCAGLLEVPFRILNGFLADKKLMSALTQLTVCMFATGLASLLCGLLSGLPGITIMLFSMSLFGTSVFSLIPIACNEMLGSENMSSAVGVNFVYQAVAMVISTFTAGGIYDRFQRWEYVYIGCFIFMTLGGSVNLSLGVVEHCRKKCSKTIKT